MDEFDLNDFASEITNVEPSNEESLPKVSFDTNHSFIGENKFVQWSQITDTLFTATHKSKKKLPSGIYEVDFDYDNGKHLFEKKEIKYDEIIEFDDSISKKIVNEIQTFWKNENLFKKYGFLHKRGYLFYGGAGCGKTTMLNMIYKQIQNAGDIILIPANGEKIINFANAISCIKEVEPNRKIVMVFEDIDAIIKEQGDEELLQLLDGSFQVNNTLVLATTNYASRLDPRIIARPRRFDRVIKVFPPSEGMRRQYLKIKFEIGNESGQDLEKWVSKTKNLSFAALADLVISVNCFQNNFEEALERLIKMAEGKVDDDDFKKKEMGFEER